MRVAFFGVTADLIGGGAGRWLMNRALELAWSRQVSRVWVHTCTLDHPSALAFYQRSGFRAFRQQVEIADDPRWTEPRRAVSRSMFRLSNERMSRVPGALQRVEP